MKHIVDRDLGPGKVRVEKAPKLKTHSGQKRNKRKRG